MSMRAGSETGKLFQIGRAFWQSEEGNEVVTWVVIAAVIVAIAAFIFGPNPNSLATALGGAVDYIISNVESVTT